MGENIVLQVFHKPITSSIALLLTSIFIYLHKQGIGYDTVGISFRSFRSRPRTLLTATFSHIEILHLLFNLNALWSLGAIETYLGPLLYLKYTSILVILTPPISLSCYAVIINVLKKDSYANVTAIGYSGILFGWMALLSVNIPGSSGHTMTATSWLSPFGSLFLTSILIPRASFVGHLSGIIAGYGIALADEIVSSMNGISLLLLLVVIIVIIITAACAYLVFFSNSCSSSSTIESITREQKQGWSLLFNKEESLLPGEEGQGEV